MEILEKKLGYTFRDPSLLRAALYHSSYANEHRAVASAATSGLEFLGDAVLGFVTAEYLYEKHPDLPEGDLTRRRAALVCEESPHEVAQALDLGSCLQLGRARSRAAAAIAPPFWPTPRSPCSPPSIWMAAWMPPATSSTASCWTRSGRRQVEERRRDYKTELQGPCQRSSPSAVTLNGVTVGEGTGRSKKEAGAVRRLCGAGARENE